jgi:hypothetical protein
MTGNDLFNKNIDELKKQIKEKEKHATQNEDKYHNLGRKNLSEQYGAKIEAYQEILKLIDELFK